MHIAKCAQTHTNTSTWISFSRTCARQILSCESHIHPRFSRSRLSHEKWSNAYRLMLTFILWFIRPELKGRKLLAHSERKTDFGPLPCAQMEQQFTLKHSTELSEWLFSFVLNPVLRQGEKWKCAPLSPFIWSTTVHMILHIRYCILHILSVTSHTNYILNRSKKFLKFFFSFCLQPYFDLHNDWEHRVKNSAENICWYY